MFNRLIKDESGMALGLVVIMILLIGVMGAGLLTFVQSDLSTVVKVNKGQRAFEMADAGVEAAKRQLASDPATNSYDNGAGDIQWADSQGGVTLNDLDSDPITADSVNVRIRYDTSSQTFIVTSTGVYDDARRKVEATFRNLGGGIPAYYSPGNIRVEYETSIAGVSMFSGGNISFDNFDFTWYPPGNQRGETNDSTKISAGTSDPLGNWDRSPWNTAPRRSATDSDLTTSGFGAEGIICRISRTSPCTPMADGFYGYDSTTGARGRNLRFFAKTPPDRVPNGTDGGTPARDIITYPFDRTAPNADNLLQLAQTQEGTGNSKYVKLDDKNPSADFNTLYNDSRSGRVVFIDAGGRTVNYTKDNNARGQGILVVRCGDLTMGEGAAFTGLIILLRGTDPGCDTTGHYRSGEKSDVKGYVYAEGIGADGIRIKEESKVSPLPPGKEGLLDIAWPNIRPQGWRELYQ